MRKRVGDTAGSVAESDDSFEQLASETLPTSGALKRMTELTELKNQIAKYEKLLPVAQSVSFVEASRRAGEFLSVQAKITNWRHLFAEEKIRLLSVQTAVYAQELAKGTAKTMTENKVTAEASIEYTKAREDFERLENDINYLKAYYDIFRDAHVFYRQMAKGEEM